VRSVIATGIGRPSAKPAAGPYRRRMKRYRDYRFGQRWQVEAAVSMIKRNLGAAVGARSFAAQCKEVMLKVLTHNIMLIAAALIELFYRAGMSPFRSCPLLSCGSITCAPARPKGDARSRCSAPSRTI
jgi:hypothetical protein